MNSRDIDVYTPSEAEAQADKYTKKVDSLLEELKQAIYKGWVTEKKDKIFRKLKNAGDNLNFWQNELENFNS